MAGRGGHAVGGIYNSGTLTLLGTDFSGNLGAGGGGGSGITVWPEFISGSGGTGVGALWNAGGSVRMDASTQGALTTGNSGAGGKVELNSWYHPLALVGQSIAGLHSPAGTVDTNYTPPPAILSAAYDGQAGTLVVTATGLQATAGAANDIAVGALTLTGQGGATYTLTSANVEIDSATQFTVQLSAADRSQLAILFNKVGLQASDASGYNLSGASGWSAAHPGNADVSGNPVIVQTALLHKSEGRRDYPSPRRSYAMAPTGTVLGRPSCVKRLSRATRTCNSTTCRSNVRAITRWPRRLKQCILVSTRLLR